MKARITSLLLTLLALAALAGCASGSSGGTAAPTANMEALQQAMLEADPSLPDMLSVTSEVDDAKKLFTYLSDFDYEKVAGYLLSYSSTGTADELAVIAVQDAADVAEAKNSLEKHRQDRLKLFQTYGPQEAARVEKGEVFTEGPYAVLLICDDADSVKEAFASYLDGTAREG